VLGNGLTNSVANSVQLGANATEAFRLMDPLVGSHSFKLVAGNSNAATYTLTATDCVGGYFTLGNAGPVTLTFPTGAQLDAQAQLAGGLYPGLSFRLLLVQTNTQAISFTTDPAGLTSYLGTGTPTTLDLIFYRTAVADTWTVASEGGADASLNINDLRLNGNVTNTALASGTFGIAEGRNTTASGNQGVAIGGSATASQGATASQQGGIAIGGASTAAMVGALASGTDAVAIGAGAAGGSGAAASAANAIALGGGSAATAGAVASAADTIAIGRAAAATASAGAIAIGQGSASNSANAIALGTGSSASGTSAVALGPSSSSGAASVAVGGSAGASGGNSVAVGDAATAAGSSVAVGQGASATGTSSSVVGQGASDAGFNNAIVLGASVAATQANQLVIGSATQHAQQLTAFVATTTATPTTLYSFPLTSSTANSLHFEIEAAMDGTGDSTSSFTGVYKARCNASGVVFPIIYGNVNSVDPAMVGVTVSTTVAANTLNVQVTGLASQNMNWSGFFRLATVAYHA
jgi:hypothetical protein